MNAAVHLALGTPRSDRVAFMSIRGGHAFRRKKMSLCRLCGCSRVVIVTPGETVSEGGFKENKVSKAALLGVEEASDKKGKPYYKFELLTTTGTCHRHSSQHNARGKHRIVDLRPLLGPNTVLLSQCSQPVAPAA